MFDVLDVQTSTHDRKTEKKCCWMFNFEDNFLPIAAKLKYSPIWIKYSLNLFTYDNSTNFVVIQHVSSCEWY